MPDDQQRRMDSDVPDSEAGGKTDRDNDKAKQPKKPGLLRRHPIAVLAGIVVVIALAIAGYYYWITYVHPYETTDDAFIDSRQFSIAAKVSGYVVNVPVTDNQHVDTGDVMFVVGRLSNRVQRKYLIATGATVVALAMYDLTNLYGDATFGFFAWSRIYIGIGLPLIFIPITTASYNGIPPGKTDQAPALINVARNVGSSIGVSIAQNVLAYREQFHQNRLVEHVVPSNPGYQETLRTASDYFASAGGGVADAQGRAIAYIGEQVATQAAYWAYIDVFFTLMLISASAVLLALILRRVKL